MATSVWQRPSWSVPAIPSACPLACQSGMSMRDSWSIPCHSLSYTPAPCCYLGYSCCQSGTPCTLPQSGTTWLLLLVGHHILEPCCNQYCNYCTPCCKFHCNLCSLPFHLYLAIQILYIANTPAQFLATNYWACSVATLSLCKVVARAMSQCRWNDSIKVVCTWWL